MPPASSPETPTSQEPASRLDADLQALHRCGRRSTGTAISGDYLQVRQIAERWLWLVEVRHQAADGSLSDRQRWSAYSAAMQHAPAESRDLTTLLSLCATTRGMLAALRSTEPPCPTAAAVAARIKNMISTDPVNYPPGASFSVPTLVRELGVPAEILAPALADLRADNILDPSITGQPRILAAGPIGAHRLEIVAWLRTLIHAGVYPPGPLPSNKELARTLAVGSDAVAAALGALATDGTVECLPGKTPSVPPNMSQPFDAVTVLGHLRQLPPPAIERVALEEVARTTRAWWRTHARPPAHELDKNLDVLRAGVLHHAPQVHRRLGPSTVTAQAVITATEPLPNGAHQKLWRAACLSSSIEDLLEALALPTPTGWGHQNQAGVPARKNTALKPSLSPLTRSCTSAQP